MFQKSKQMQMENLELFSKISSNYDFQILLNFNKFVLFLFWSSDKTSFVLSFIVLPQEYKL